MAHITDLFPALKGATSFTLSMEEIDNVNEDDGSESPNDFEATVTDVVFEDGRRLDNMSISFQSDSELYPIAVELSGG